jgi:hypothetical protein
MEIPQELFLLSDSDDDPTDHPMIRLKLKFNLNGSGRFQVESSHMMCFFGHAILGDPQWGSAHSSGETLGKD